MSLLYDANGYVIGDDGVIETDVNTGGVTGSRDTAPDTGFIARKTAEYQHTLDDVVQIADNLMYLKTLPLAQNQIDLVDEQLAIFESRRAAYKYAAVAINSIADIGNAVGANLPKLRVPSGLGFALFGLPLAEAAALATLAGLILVSVTWVATSHSVALSAAESLSEPYRTEALQRISAQQNGGISGAISETATSIKWIAIAALAYFAFQSYQKGK